MRPTHNRRAAFARQQPAQPASRLRERGDIAGDEVGGRYLHPSFPFARRPRRCSHRSQAEHDMTLTTDSATATRGNAAVGLDLRETAGGSRPFLSTPDSNARSPTPQDRLRLPLSNTPDELAQRQQSTPSELIGKAVENYIPNALRLNTPGEAPQAHGATVEKHRLSISSHNRREGKQRSCWR